MIIVAVGLNQFVSADEMVNKLEREANQHLDHHLSHANTADTMTHLLMGIWQGNAEEMSENVGGLMKPSKQESWQVGQDMISLKFKGEIVL